MQRHPRGGGVTAELEQGVRLLAPRHLTPPAAVQGVEAAETWPPFDARAMAFVVALSSAILKDPGFRTAPEMIAFAYQMRRRPVFDLSGRLRPSGVQGLLRGRGLAVHFAPSNVDTIFLYSLLLSLLSGNANIVRLSGKVSASVDRVVELLADLLESPDHAAMRDRIVLLRYDHDDAITKRLCQKADVRVIWGGDGAVQAIRRAPLNTLAHDIVFPDRWSMAVFDADFYLERADRDDVAKAFANDVYWFGQMACSSPRIIAWRGGDACVREAEADFYRRLHEAARRFAGELAPIDMVNKRVFEDVAAVDHAAHVTSDVDGLVSVSHVAVADILSPEVHCGAGAFLACGVDSLDALSSLFQPRLQTVVSLGISAEDWTDVLASGVAGIDRIVAPGQALNFASVWDGMDLLREFTRETSMAL